MTSDIVFIGPFGAGKSTLAKLLSRRLGWLHYSLDEQQEKYFKEREDYQILEEKRHTWGLDSPKWQPYHAYAVERFLSEYSNADKNYVFDFGPGHSVYEDEQILSRIERVMAPYNVVFVLPSPDLEESLELLVSQIIEHPIKPLYRSVDRTNEINRHFISHHSNHTLAKITVYTKDKSPDETCKEIIERLNIELGTASK